MKYFLYIVILLVLVGLVISGKLVSFISPEFLLKNFELIFLFLLLIPGSLLFLGYYKIYNKAIKKIDLNKKPIIKITSVKKKIVFYSLIILGFLGLSLGLDYVISLFFVKNNVRQDMLIVTFLTIGPIIAILIAGGMAIVEELFFRKLLQNYLEDKITKKYKLNIILSISMVAIIFTVIHFTGVAGFIGIFILGLILSILYYIFRDIKLNILIHVINNVIGVLFLFYTIGHGDVALNEDINYYKEVKEIKYSKHIGYLDTLNYFYAVILNQSASKDIKDNLFASLSIKYDPFMIESLNNSNIEDITKILESKETKEKYAILWEELKKNKEEIVSHPIGEKFYNNMYNIYSDILDNKIEK